jgi:hypothetical protein
MRSREARHATTELAVYTRICRREPSDPSLDESEFGRARSEHLLTDSELLCSLADGEEALGAKRGATRSMGISWWLGL